MVLVLVMLVDVITRRGGDSAIAYTGASTTAPSTTRKQRHR